MLMDFWQAASPYLLPVYYLVIVAVVANILLESRNPLKTHSYLLLLLLLPIVGIIIYLFFGQNIRKRKIFSKSALINSAFGKEYINQYVNSENSKELTLTGAALSFERLIHFLNHDLSPLTNSNKVTLLTNGEDKFPKLLEALRNAKEHIHLEYYIFTEDTIGNEIVDILIAKSIAGLDVKLIVDDVGSFKLSRSFFRRLKEAGVQVHRFMPVFFPLLTSKVNYRDHRKIAVIDGTIGFVGGINLDDRYMNNGRHDLYWRDTHLLIEGEAVKSLQLVFLLNWQFVTREEILNLEQYFPKPKSNGNQFMQINASGPDWDLASIMDSFFIAITSAKKVIRISTPYFIPSESILNALILASRTGVQVEIILPQKSDSTVVQAASMSFVSQLLDNGVDVYMYKKGFMHAKVLIVDDLLGSVGTSNMDHRSFDHNHEVNAYFYDQELTLELCSQFEQDKLDSIQITSELWADRKISQKLLESASRLLAPLL